jgi:hypothetical protein
MIARNRDPLKKELKSIRRRAFIDVQLGRDEDGEPDEANQRYHLADMALDALKGKSPEGGGR